MANSINNLKNATGDSKNNSTLKISINNMLSDISNKVQSNNTQQQSKKGGNNERNNKIMMQNVIATKNHSTLIKQQ